MEAISLLSTFCSQEVRREVDGMAEYKAYEWEKLKICLEKQYESRDPKRHWNTFAWLDGLARKQAASEAPLRQYIDEYYASYQRINTRRPTSELYAVVG